MSEQYEYEELLQALARAHKLICGLLGAPPPRLWDKRYPNLYRQAIEFLHSPIMQYAAEYDGPATGGDREDSKA